MGRRKLPSEQRGKRVNVYLDPVTQRILSGYQTTSSGIRELVNKEIPYAHIFITRSLDRAMIEVCHSNNSSENDGYITTTTGEHFAVYQKNSPAIYDSKLDEILSLYDKGMILTPWAEFTFGALKTILAYWCIPGYSELLRDRNTKYAGRD